MPQPPSPETSAEKPAVICLMGPTASGKTRLAIDLAEALDGEVISVDSALVYRGMDIGTAKPDRVERRGIPHHLIDIIDPAEAYSTGRFLDDALALIDAIIRRGKRPILAGGTMLYFNALFSGLADLPTADPEIRRALDEEAARYGWAALHAELKKCDPAAAARIHPNDPQRIQRALEVFRITGIPLTALCEPKTPDLPFLPVKLVVAPDDRVLMRERIRQRFLRMLDAGLIEEVRKLFERGDLHPDMPSIRAVGYRQVWAHLAGELDHESMIEKAVIATGQFAKRQFTWLRRAADARWYLSERADLGEAVLRDLRASFFVGRA